MLPTLTMSPLHWESLKCFIKFCVSSQHPYNIIKRRRKNTKQKQMWTYQSMKGNVPKLQKYTHVVRCIHFIKSKSQAKFYNQNIKTVVRKFKIFVLKAWSVWTNRPKINETAKIWSIWPINFFGLILNDLQSSCIKSKVKKIDKKMKINKKLKKTQIIYTKM